jgi:2-polyprenyl-6-methoxyphenol hydroxylase-like FAD-dependent oxidoreductase
MRSLLQEVLFEEAKRLGVEVEFGKGLESLAQEDGKVFAVFSDGTVLETELLIGSDGIHFSARDHVVHPGVIVMEDVAH